MLAVPPDDKFIVFPDVDIMELPEDDEDPDDLLEDDDEYDVVATDEVYGQTPPVCK